VRDPVDVPVSYRLDTDKSMAAAVARVVLDEQDAATGVELRPLHRHPTRDHRDPASGRQAPGRVEVAVVEGSPVTLIKSCSAGLVAMHAAVRLSEPVDPLDPPSVYDGVDPGPVPIEPTQ
jgi:hypothetical protein